MVIATVLLVSTLTYLHCKYIVYCKHKMLMHRRIK